MVWTEGASSQWRRLGLNSWAGGVPDKATPGVATSSAVPLSANAFMAVSVGFAQIKAELVE